MKKGKIDICGGVCNTPISPVQYSATSIFAAMAWAGPDCCI